MSVTGPERMRYGTPQRFSRFGYLLVLLTFGVCGGWAAWARIDSATVAPAIVELEGQRKVVQHLEGGIVQTIHVREAESVRQGDVLITLESVEAKARVQRVRTRLEETLAIEARLRAEQNLEATIAWPADLTGSSSAALRTVMELQATILADRLAVFGSERDILRFRIEQLETQKAGRALQRDALERRLALQAELVERLAQGEASGVVGTNVLSARRDSLIELEASLGEVISQEAGIGAALAEARLTLLKLSQEFRERAGVELRDVRTQLKDLREQLTVAEDIDRRTEIRAPSDGVAQAIGVHTQGAVIRPGAVLMEIVPPDDTLLVAARVSPTDIDNVMPGQESEVRFTAFNARLTPVVLGQVESVSQDIITPGQQGGEPYFLARVRVPEENMSDDIRGRLTPGMPAEVVIINGERSVINYLISPLTDAIAVSLREK